MWSSSEKYVERQLSQQLVISALHLLLLQTSGSTYCNKCPDASLVDIARHPNLTPVASVVLLRPTSPIGLSCLCCSNQFCTKKCTLSLSLYIYIYIYTPHCPLREIPITLPWQRHHNHKSSATHSYQCVQYFHVQTMVWLPLFGIFNVRTDVGVCNCTQGLYRRCKTRESALKVDSGRKIPGHTMDLNLHQ